MAERDVALSICSFDPVITEATRTALQGFINGRCQSIYRSALQKKTGCEEPECSIFRRISCHEHSAVHVEGVAGDVGGFLGREERYGMSDI